MRTFSVSVSFISTTSHFGNSRFSKIFFWSSLSKVRAQNRSGEQWMSWRIVKVVMRATLAPGPPDFW